jgi:hypothetical protein
LRFIVLGEGAGVRAPIHVAVGPGVLKVMGVTVVLSAMLIVGALVLALAVKTIAAYVPALLQLMPALIILSLIAISARWLLAYPIAAITGRIDFEAARILVGPIYRRFLALIMVLAGAIALVDFGLNSAVVPLDAADLGAITAAFVKHWPLITIASFASNLFAIASFFTLLGIVYRLRTKEQSRGSAVAGPRTQPSPQDERAP